MKSSYSQETNCVDVRPAPSGGVWLSETTGAGAVYIPAGSWNAFIQGVKDGDFDHLTDPDDEPAPDDERAAYIRGLRNLANLLAANPDLALPQSGRSSVNPLYTVLSRYTGQREQLAAWLRHMAGTTSVVDGPDCRVRGTVGDLHVTLVADRDAVCQRVVVGAWQVAGQDASMEDVEWVCPPLAADRNVGTTQ